METVLRHGNVVKICVLLCIVNGMEISALRDYRDLESDAHRQSGACDWPQEYVPSTNCSCINQAMSCVHDIPKTVPMSITTVIVRKYLGNEYHEGLFADESWSHVEELAIDTSEAMHFHDNSFTGLSKLQTLTLTGMTYISSFGDLFLGNNSIPNLKTLTVNPGLQEGKPEILLNEESFTGLLKRPIKQVNFSNVLLDLVSVEDTLLVAWALIGKVLNITDTIVVVHPSMHRTQTISQTGRGPQPKNDTLNQTSQQEKYLYPNKNRFLDIIDNKRNRETTDSFEINVEPTGDAVGKQLINKSIKFKANFVHENRTKTNTLKHKQNQNTLDFDIFSQRNTNVKQQQPWIMAGFSSTTPKRDTGPTLNSLDISGSVFNIDPGRKAKSIEQDNSHSKTRILASFPFQDYFTTIEHSYLNRLFKVDVNIIGNLNKTGTPIYIKTVTFRNNRLVVVNGTVTLDDNNPVVSIDVSYNKLQYIAKTVLWCLKNLKTLNLSWNKLYKMQHDLEFGQLFMNLTKLKLLSLAHNSLSFLHRNMFKLNKQLEVLLFNDNKLSSLDIDLNGLDSLQILDLRNNKIKIISEVQINELSSYFDSRMLPNKSINFQFLLQGNPLQCACKSKKLLKMFLFYQKFLYRTVSEPITCSCQGNEITINKDALDKADYLCKRVMIIVISTIATTVTSVVIGILVVVWWRRRKRRQKQDLLGWFVREFRNDNLRETHLAFIAMSGNEDDRGLMQTVVADFHAFAKQCLKTQKKLILTGYDFIPGFPIVSEAYRMIKSSCVVMAFVSKSFCQSRYCMMELQEACKQDKPLILVFTEHIDEDLMTPYMLEVFKRYARGRLEQKEDGEWEMSPSMDKICEAMIALASEQYRHEFA